MIDDQGWSCVCKVINCYILLPPSETERDNQTTPKSIWSMILAERSSLRMGAKCRNRSLRNDQNTAECPILGVSSHHKIISFAVERLRALQSNLHPTQGRPERFPQLLFLTLDVILYSSPWACFGKLGMLLRHCWHGIAALKFTLRYWEGVNCNSLGSSWHSVCHQSACKTVRLTLKPTLWLVKN